jgi:uncharacterized repeat protein (TIGR01451 family)
MVGAVRFELTTSCTRNKRATRLRYAPTLSRKVCLRIPSNATPKSLIVPNYSFSKLLLLVGDKIWKYLSVKFFPNFFRILLLALALHFITARAGAQTIGLFAAPSSSSVNVSNQITYTIFVTNNSPALEEITVTNTFSGALPVTFVTDATTGTMTNTTNSFTFFMGPVDVGNIAEATLTVEPLALGNLTDTIVAFSAAGITNATETTNVVVDVLTTNLADLSVMMSGFPPIVYSNDWVTYEVSVTNAGPAAATDVILTNTFPTNDVELISASPTNYTTVNSNLIFSLGTILAGTGTNLEFTVQPTNTGVFAFSASVESTNQMDPNTTNNFFTTNMTVTNFLSGTANLTASASSAQVFNRQTGREQQVITLSNTGGTPISAARVIVTGLTNWLFNAVGTNNGNPYVVYGTSLANGSSVNLNLQFYPNRSSFPLLNSQLVPVEIEQPDLSMPQVLATSSAINIVLATNFSPGDTLVEFQSISNRSYTIAYSDDMTNWLAAQPPFRTTANYVLWIDYGPPETLSNSPSRFYRVYMDPQTQ